MKCTIKLTGDKAADRVLASLEKKVQKVLLKSAMRAGLKPVLQAARKLAPVKTGLLRRMIKLRAMKRSRKSFGSTVGVGEKDFQGKAWYGAAQEYGTSKMPGKGFLRKAWDETKDTAAKIAIGVIKAGVKVSA